MDQVTQNEYIPIKERNQPAFDNNSITNVVKKNVPCNNLNGLIKRSNYTLNDIEHMRGYGPYNFTYYKSSDTIPVIPVFPDIEKKSTNNNVNYRKQKNLTSKMAYFKNTNESNSMIKNNTQFYTNGSVNGNLYNNRYTSRGCGMSSNINSSASVYSGKSISFSSAPPKSSKSYYRHNNFFNDKTNDFLGINYYSPYNNPINYQMNTKNSMNNNNNGANVIIQNEVLDYYPRNTYMKKDVYVDYPKSTKMQQKLSPNSFNDCKYPIFNRKRQIQNFPNRQNNEYIHLKNNNNYCPNSHEFPFISIKENDSQVISSSNQFYNKKTESYIQNGKNKDYFNEKVLIGSNEMDFDVQNFIKNNHNLNIDESLILQNSMINDSNVFSNKPKSNMKKFEEIINNDYSSNISPILNNNIGINPTINKSSIKNIHSNINNSNYVLNNHNFYDEIPFVNNNTMAANEKNSYFKKPLPLNKEPYYEFAIIDLNKLLTNKPSFYINNNSKEVLQPEKKMTNSFYHENKVDFELHCESEIDNHQSTQMQIMIDKNTNDLEKKAVFSNDEKLNSICEIKIEDDINLLKIKQDDINYTNNELIPFDKNLLIRKYKSMDEIELFVDESIQSQKKLFKNNICESLTHLSLNNITTKDNSLFMDDNYKILNFKNKVKSDFTVDPVIELHEKTNNDEFLNSENVISYSSLLKKETIFTDTGNLINTDGSCEINILNNTNPSKIINHSQIQLQNDGNNDSINKKNKKKDSLENLHNNEKSSKNNILKTDDLNQKSNLNDKLIENNGFLQEEDKEESKDTITDFLDNADSKKKIIFKHFLNKKKKNFKNFFVKLKRKTSIKINDSIFNDSNLCLDDYMILVFLNDNSIDSGVIDECMKIFQELKTIDIDLKSLNKNLSNDFDLKLENFTNVQIKEIIDQKNKLITLLQKSHKNEKQLRLIYQNTIFKKLHK